MWQACSVPDPVLGGLKCLICINFVTVPWGGYYFSHLEPGTAWLLSRTPAQGCLTQNTTLAHPGSSMPPHGCQMNWWGGSIGRIGEGLQLSRVLGCEYEFHFLAPSSPWLFFLKWVLVCDGVGWGWECLSEDLAVMSHLSRYIKMTSLLDGTSSPESLPIPWLWQASKSLITSECVKLCQWRAVRLWCWTHVPRWMGTGWYTFPRWHRSAKEKGGLRCQLQVRPGTSDVSTCPAASDMPLVVPFGM